MALRLHHLARWALPKPDPGAFFAARERRTLAAAAEVLLDGAAVTIPPVDVATNIERFLLRGRSQRAWRVRILLNILEHAPLLTGQGRFSTLSMAARAALFHEKFIGGRHIWGICSKVKHLVLLGAYGDPRTWSTLGFVPVPARDRYRQRGIAP